MLELVVEVEEQLLPVDGEIIIGVMIGIVLTTVRGGMYIHAAD
jgi:hypothetical protein